MEHISNENKAREIAMTNCRCEGCFAIDTIDDCFHSALQAMQWKDEQHKQEKQQWIDKAAEWFGNYLFDIGYPDDWLRDSPNTINGKTRFIQAMKGE